MGWAAGHPDAGQPPATSVQTAVQQHGQPSQGPTRHPQDEGRVDAHHGMGGDRALHATNYLIGFALLLWTTRTSLLHLICEAGRLTRYTRHIFVLAHYKKSVCICSTSFKQLQHKFKFIQTHQLECITCSTVLCYVHLAPCLNNQN